MQALINKISNAFQQPLPGREVQYQMAAMDRANDLSIKLKNPKDASVLILLYPKNEETHIVLIERTSKNKNDRHAGQISFPGGRHDAEDINFEMTAIREAHEEVGVAKNDIRILGQLTDLMIPVSNFLVHPFVGYCETTPEFIPEIAEVKTIIEVPLSHLQNPDTRRTTDLVTPLKWKLTDVPYFNIDGHVLWGATAMILNEFLEMVGP